jgi:hypothetical protein
MAKPKGRRSDKQGRSEGEPAFVQLPWWLIESPAFHALSPEGKVALLYLTKRFNGRNNGQIVFGVRMGGRVRNPGQPDAAVQDRPIMSKTKLTAVLKEVEALKLAEIAKQSSFGQKKLAREWRLAWLPCDGKAAGRDFMAFSETDCARILAEQSSKARSARRPDDAPTGLPAGQSALPTASPVPSQVRPQTYEQLSQVRPQTTSSNHPSGESMGEVAAA